MKPKIHYTITDIYKSNESQPNFLQDLNELDCEFLKAHTLIHNDTPFFYMGSCQKQYDKHDHKVSELWTTAEDGERLYRNWEYIYPDGWKTPQKVIYVDNNDYRHELEYEQEGYLIKEEICYEGLDPGNVMVKKYNRKEFNEAGLPTLIEVFISDIVDDERVTYLANTIRREYNEKGEAILETRAIPSDLDMDLYSEEAYEKRRGVGVLGAYVKIEVHDSCMTHRTTIRYDEDGKIRSVLKRCADGQTEWNLRYSRYEYDQYGNWITRYIKYSMTKDFAEIQKRTIKYYEE